MAILNQKRILNLIPKTSAPVTIHVSQGDVGTQIQFTLIKGDETFDGTENISATIHGKRQDGANFGPYGCTLNGSTLSFLLKSAMTAVSGSAIAEVVLTDDDGNKVGSSNFGIMVEDATFPTGVTYDNDVSVYEAILAYCQTIPAEIIAVNNELYNMIATEASTRASSDSELDARIDEIIAPTGEAPSAAEVTDARIGADGVTYNSLGTAIRTQFTDVEKGIRHDDESNSIDLLYQFGAFSDGTSQGVTYTWNSDKTKCTANGTVASGKTSTNQLYNNTTGFPSQITPGGTYYCEVDGSNLTNLYVQFYFYMEGGGTENINVREKGVAIISVPSNAIGFNVRLRAVGTVTNETVSVRIFNQKSNKQLNEDIAYAYKNILRGSLLSQYESIDNIIDVGVYFKSTDSSIEGFPFVAGWLIVLPATYNINSNCLQLAYPWQSYYGVPVFRERRSGVWNEWQYYGGGEDSELVNILKQDLISYNIYDLYSFTGGTTGSNSGILYTKNSDGTWTIDGETTSDPSFRNLISSADRVPSYVVPGKTYNVEINSNVVLIQFYFYYSDGSSTSKSIRSAGSVTIPSNITGVIIRFYVNRNTTVDNETVTVSMVSQEDRYLVEQTIYNDTINNEYSIVTTPHITTDENGWLQAVDTASADESDKTDMTGAIMSMLNDTGYCHLAPGVFYVSGSIDMPEGSMIEGCGKKTELRLLSSVTSGYIIKMQKYCTVQNLSLIGSYSDLSDFTDEKGTRNGLIFNARYESGGGQTEYCIAHNLFIRNFTGAGIKCYDTSISTAKGLYASDIDIRLCQTGLLVEYYSEFNKFDHVCTRACYNACENNGGNNVFIGCTFHSTNIGFLIDNSLGDKPNNSHGSMIGCTFCHIGNNAGKAISIKNIPHGFVFSGCQVWYCSIELEDAVGVVFNAMEFGRGTTGAGATIRVDGGDTVIFNGCIFMNDAIYPPDIAVTNNEKVKFVGCYGSATGNEITIN